jgi:aspartate/methionine/tyrosine aminotransferase
MAEAILHTPNGLYNRLVKAVTSDVVFLVNPNNPTGFCLDEFGDKAFRELARYCHDHDKLLVLDLCFMPFICRDPKFKHIDCYEILNEYDVNYITIEDTGKIFPIMDTKAAIMHVSDRLVPKFERLHTNYILRHSPFVLKIVTNFIKDSIATDLAASYNLVQQNYNYLAEAIKNHRLPLSISKRTANLSIAWLAVRPPLTGQDVQQAAQKQGIELLKGSNFFWDNPDQGLHFIRIALARNTKEFEQTIDKLAGIL